MFRESSIMKASSSLKILTKRASRRSSPCEHLLAPRRRRRRTKASSAFFTCCLGQLGEPRHVHVGGQRRRLVQIDRPLGDVHRQVADALEVGDDLQRGGDEAQVARGRLPERQDLPAQLVDLDLEPVDLVVRRP